MRAARPSVIEEKNDPSACCPCTLLTNSLTMDSTWPSGPSEDWPAVAAAWNTPLMMPPTSARVWPMLFRVLMPFCTHWSNWPVWVAWVRNSPRRAPASPRYWPNWGKYAELAAPISTMAWVRGPAAWFVPASVCRVFSSMVARPVWEASLDSAAMFARSPVLISLAIPARPVFSTGSCTVARFVTSSAKPSNRLSCTANFRSCHWSPRACMASTNSCAFGDRFARASAKGSTPPAAEDAPFARFSRASSRRSWATSTFSFASSRVRCASASPRVAASTFSFAS